MPRPTLTSIWRRVWEAAPYAYIDMAARLGSRALRSSLDMRRAEGVAPYTDVIAALTALLAIEPQSRRVSGSFDFSYATVIQCK